MLELKGRLRYALLKLYGEDQEHVDKQVEDLDNRVKERRRERVRAGASTQYRRKHTAEEYESWMNLND